MEPESELRTEVEDAGLRANGGRGRVHLSVLLVALTLLALGFITGESGSTSVLAAQQKPTSPDTIASRQSVRLYLKERADAGRLADQGIDVPEYVFDSDRPGYIGYILTEVEPDQYSRLHTDGVAIEVLGAPDAVNWDAACYEDYPQILAHMQRIATDHPDLATLSDIGDSWEKLHPGADRVPRDLWQLRLTSARPGPKPVVYIVAEHHAREIATPALTMAWVDSLIAGYGVDPDITALLDYKEILVVPMQNPDGYAKVSAGELGGGVEWRKNTDNDDGCAGGSYGVDTNRNYDVDWAGPCPTGGCSSTNCNSLVYRGPEAASEPEVQAMQADFLAKQPDLVLSLHTYGPLVLYPYGNTSDPAPDAADLDAMAWNFARINSNTPRSRTGQSPDVLYAVTGAADDWTYENLGIPSFTIELGGYVGFDMPCEVLEPIKQIYQPVLSYVAAVTENSPRASYDRAWGPTPSKVVVSSGTGESLQVTGVLSSNYGSLLGTEYFVDDLGANGAGTTMSGNFGGTSVGVEATFSSSALVPGRHTIYVRGRNDQGRWGIVSSAFFEVAAPGTVTPAPTATPCTINFSDVATGDYFYEPVRYLFCAGAVSGYSDNTFRPFASATRSQVAKIVVLAEGWPISTSNPQRFSDVPPENSFYPFVQTVAARGIVAGYADGTFRPYNNVTRGQLAKIIVQAEGWTPRNPADPTFSDVPTDSPFFSYVETAAAEGVISGYNTPEGVEFRPGNEATRGQIAKIIYAAVIRP